MGSSRQQPLMQLSEAFATIYAPPQMIKVIAFQSVAYIDLPTQALCECFAAQTKHARSILFGHGVQTRSEDVVIDDSLPVVGRSH